MVNSKVYKNAFKEQIKEKGLFTRTYQKIYQNLSNM